MAFNVNDYLEAYINEATRYLISIQNTNFTHSFPNTNFDELYPQLKVGMDGYPKIDIDEIIQGMKINRLDYVDFDFNDVSFQTNLGRYFFNSNPNFEILNTLQSLAYQEMSIKPEMDKTLNTLIINYKLRFQVLTMEEVYDYMVDDGNAKKKREAKVEEENNEVSDNNEQEEYEEVITEPIYTTTEFKTKNGTLAVEING